jgi:WD40 repeat protein
LSHAGATLGGYRALHAQRARGYGGAAHLTPVARPRTRRAGGDGSAQVWDVTNGQQLFAVHAPTDWFNTPLVINCAVWSPDGHYLLTAGEDKAATLWPAAGGEAVLTLRGHGSRLNSAAFRPDSRAVVTSSDDNTARIWDIPACRPAMVPGGKPRPRQGRPATGFRLSAYNP